MCKMSAHQNENCSKNRWQHIKNKKQQRRQQRIMNERETHTQRKRERESMCVGQTKIVSAFVYRILEFIVVFGECKVLIWHYL